MKYEESIILTGGRLVMCDESNPKQTFSFKRISKDYMEINCKLLVTLENFQNVIRTTEDFVDEAEIDGTKNLVILGTKKATNDKLSYEQEIENGQISVAFDKKNKSAKINIAITSINNTIKTDHGGNPTKTDHSYFPWEL